MSANAARIRELYDSTLKPRIDALEGLRRSLKSNLTKAMLLTAGPIVLLLGSQLFASFVSDAVAVMVVIVLILAIIAGVIVTGFKYVVPGFTAYVNYTARFKREVVAEIFKVVSPDVSYAAEQGIPTDIFDAGGIFRIQGGTLSDDRVRGKIGETPFEAAEVKRSYTTSGKNSRTHVVFHGLFFHLDFNKALKGLTIVQPEGVTTCELGSRDGLTKIELESPTFESKFAVYTSDAVEARYILTPGMMEQLLSLRERADKPIFLAFKNNRAYLAIHFGRALFEPSVASTTSLEAIEEMAEHFGLAEFVVHELGLNTRIWTKDVDESLLARADEKPDGLVEDLIAKGGELKADELWKKAMAEVGNETEHKPTPRPEGSRIRVESTADGAIVSYGFRLSFWVCLLLTVMAGAVMVSALRGYPTEMGLDAIRPWLITLPAIPFLDRFVPEVALPFLIAAVVVAGISCLGWILFVRRVVITADAIRIYRGLRPFARTYSRTIYGKVVRLPQAVYIGKKESLALINVTASPNLSEAESRWIAWEMQQALNGGSRGTT